MVPSSSADVTRVLRGCFRGGFTNVSFRFVYKVKKNVQRCGNALVLSLRYVLIRFRKL